MSSRDEILLVGAGAVATALACALSSSAEFEGQINIWARDPAQAQHLAAQCSRKSVAAQASLAQALSSARTILICVSDSSIEAVVSNLLDQGAVAPPGAVVLHTCGYLGAEVLAPLHEFGYETGALHPVVAITRNSAAQSFEGILFGVSGSEPARIRAESISHILGGNSVLVKEQSRGLYHGAAALLSGGMVALFAEAESCLTEALEDVDEQTDARLAARQILRKLLESTTNNLIEKAPMDALTGPVSRGESEVVKGHGRSFEKGRFDRAGRLYELLTETMKELVRLRDQGPK